MENSKLITILKTLSKLELNRFLEFVNSDYFNKNEQVKRLAAFLETAYPGFAAEKLDKKHVFPLLWPGQEFNEQKLRYVMTDLTKLLEGFLVHQKLQSYTVYYNHLLAESFGERSVEKYSPAVLDISEKLISSDDREDEHHYFNRFILEVDKYRLVSEMREADVESSLKKVIRSVDIYYIINKLKYSCEIINRTRILSGNYEPLLLKEILSYLKNNKHEHLPAIAIYYRILLSLLESENEAHYYKLKTLIWENKEQFSRAEINDMYIYARNYCTRKINNGELNFLQELLDLYVVLLDDRIIFQEGYLSQWDYKNIVTNALRLEKYEWTESFIHQYKKYLKPSESENAYTYNLALLHYYNGDFNKTLELLQNVEFTDVFYQLSCKSLLLMAYFDLEEYDPLISLMDSFYILLKRHKKISSYTIESHLNFLKFLKRLNKIRYSNNPDFKKLEKEIMEAKSLRNKSLLLTKLDEITKQKSRGRS